MTQLPPSTPRLLPWRAAFGLTAATWGLMVFGASVRVNKAGLACPDWPLCFGEVIPTIDYGVFFEFGHRVVAGGIGLLYAALGIAVFWSLTSRRTKALWVFGAVALIAQIVFGGLTVLRLLAEWTVTGHLLLGSTFCLSILLVGLSMREDCGVDKPSESVSLLDRGLVTAVGVVLPIQIALGGLVSSGEAGLVCPDWPTCAGPVWFPTFQGDVGLQIVHRLVAYGLVGLVVGMVLSASRSTLLRQSAFLLGGLVVLQVLLGIGNVLLRLPVEVTLSHTGVAAWLVLTTGWLNWRAWRAPLRSAIPSSPLVEAR